MIYSLIRSISISLVQSMPGYSTRNKPFAIIITILLLLNFLILHNIYTRALTTTDTPPYPTYHYFYDGSESREDNFKCINEARRADTERECPELFIIGARKGGTTSLYQYISQHREFRGQGLDKGASAGEIHYFSFFFLRRSWEEYVSRFGERDEHMTGESSVSYLTSCMTPYRLTALCGSNPVIVVLLREPVRRIVSTYVMRYQLLAEKKESLEDFVSEGVRREIVQWKQMLAKNGLEANQLIEDDMLCLFKPAENQINEGLYAMHLNRWFKYFPRENFLIWKSESFRDSPSHYLSLLITRLGLEKLSEDELHEITSVYYNENKYNSTTLMREEDREYLVELYKPFNQQLAAVLGEDYSWEQIT